MTSQPLLSIRDVHRDYATVHAVRGVSLEINRGEYVAVIGPSGCGKSTLLNLLGAIDRPTRGTVSIDGTVVSSLPDRDATHFRLTHIGFVFQRFYLIPVLTARENVELPMAEAKIAPPVRRERARELLGYVGLAERADHRPAELSGGEQQRVAIARAIATRPKLILADEPTGNLDSHTGRLILDLLRELNHDDGVTIVMVTHNMFAASYGDRTLELRDGRLVRDVTPPRDVAVGWKGD